ncbi:MAG TPA: metal-dependent transcriptional regulator [Tepidisphaeraceae bacterium]|nr:metal-dependent transcriptional regulator [Tepidisphaeraceae bacterium]
MASSTVENYVKRIFLAQQTTADGLVPVGQLATIMNVVPGTATSMVKALSDSGLAEYAPRTGVRLTRGGEQLALHVLRRHRLLELFLVKALGLDWSEVHTEAEELEHAVSDRVLERIDDFLGHPSVDPHGDPIPSARGKMAEPSAVSLADCEVKKRLRVSRVADQQPAFLQLMERSGLIPGALVRVENRDEVAGAVVVVPGGDDPVVLGFSAARKVFVE